MPSSNADFSRPRRLPLEALPAALWERARHLGTLRRRVAERMSEAEAAHLVGVSMQRDVLTIFADSPVWCTRLRYRAAELQEGVAALFERAPRLEFRTLPQEFAASPAAARSALSPSAIATLHAAAATVTDHQLASALRRLAGDRT